MARSKRQRRKALYPARWAWDEEVPFSLIQADVKDILDKKALGTALWQHIRRQRLPRYQWTACDGRSRLRFLAYSHRTDDEEFYRPYLMQTTCDQHLVDLAARWLYFYNVLSPHLGKQMAKSTRLQVLHRLGYSGHDRIALLPPILLGSISTDLLLSCDPEGGNDLLAITGYLVMRGAASEASPHASPYGSANAQWAGPDPGRTPLSPTAATLGSEALR